MSYRGLKAIKDLKRIKQQQKGRFFKCCCIFLFLTVFCLPLPSCARPSPFVINYQNTIKK